MVGAPPPAKPLKSFAPSVEGAGAAESPTTPDGQLGLETLNRLLAASESEP